MTRRLRLGAALCSLFVGASAVAQQAPNQQAAPTTAQAAATAAPSQVRIVTFNIENWRNHFFAFKMNKRAATQPAWDDDVKELIANARRDADTENWAAARAILDPSVKPDIMVIQEGCSLEDLNYFNTQFLNGYFDTVHIFPSNTEREQTIGILMRPGFKVLEYREDFHKEPDTAGVNTVGTGLLFARGPAFAHVQAPDGTTFWVGTNHAKSKSGNSVEVTKWRNAEAKRTHEILQELRKIDPEVIFLGDLNDELGYQEFELEAGGSTIDLLIGSGDDALVLATKPLVDKAAISFHGRMRGRHRSFIDHAIITPEVQKYLKDVSVSTTPHAEYASDHYPVVLTFEFAK